MNLTPKAPLLRAQILTTLARSATPMIPKEIRQATGLTPGEVNHGTQSARKGGLATLTSAGWVITDAGRAALAQLPAPQPVRAPTPAPQPAQTASASLAFALSSYADRVAAEVVAQVRAKVDMAIAAMAIDLDIESRIATLLHAKLDVQLEAPVEVSLDDPLPTKAHLRRVVILGLIPVQEHEVVQSHGDLFDLRFITMTQPGDVKGRCANADLVIGMTKFMNHKVHDTLKAAGIKYRPCNGSATSLKRDLDAYLAEVTAPAQ